MPAFASQKTKRPSEGDFVLLFGYIIRPSPNLFPATTLTLSRLADSALAARLRAVPSPAALYALFFWRGMSLEKEWSGSGSGNGSLLPA
ncbi:hypothetical protein A2609_02685 [Candidatus Kaiserbacteria bacterium RIFOXYD1_FULL_47_14]|uniref:Uncharacterized protein n=1 Tax=Candidatus Kaiserbacteria bacterium RIFOXYD1_FULL_47_14 TaxID=1798533 RepID=A0A1F6G4X5_9BACT|nr:MAG: hypothetical protein A2609_02685 [Candidatus Kaiserbacteria bacterium RIFOXYD1_FULL_47_14]